MIHYAPMSSAYVVIAHGSREKKSSGAFLEFLEGFRKANPKRKVEAAFLELARPSIPQAIEKVIHEGATEVFIIPWMLFPGRHVKEHIPAFIEDAKRKHPESDFHYAGPLCDGVETARLPAERRKKRNSKFKNRPF